MFEELPFDEESASRPLAAAPQGTRVRASMPLGNWGLAHLASSLTTDGSPRLVGRELESVRLLHAINEVLRDDAAVVVSVSGAPGAGKTRLIEDTLVVAEASGFEGRVFRVAAERGDAPHATIARLLAARFRLDGKTEALKRDSLRRRVSELLGEDRVTEVCYDLGVLLGGSFEPSVLAELALKKSVCELFAADSGVAPLCLVIEDLHHIDRVSLGILLALSAELRPGTLLLCSGHPHFFQRNERFGQGGVARYEAIELPPLQRHEVRALLRQVAGPCVLGAEAFERYVLESGLGNPGFIQELVRELWAYGTLQTSESGDGCELHESRWPEPESSPRLKVAADVRVAPPSGLESSLLEAASVVGSAFWAGMWPVLLPVSAPLHADVNPEDVEQALASLESEGHLLRMPDSRIEGEVELIFRDGQERERLESGVSTSRRRGLHRLIGEWLSSHAAAPDSSSDVAALAAHHLSCSGASQRAACLLLDAARLACQEQADTAAVGYLEQALDELGEQDDRMRMEALGQLGAVLRRLGRSREAARVAAERAELTKEWRTSSVRPWTPRLATSVPRLARAR